MNNYHSTKATMEKVFFVRLTASLLMFIFGILFGISANGQEAKQKSNFYAITGNELKDTSWLFGTYHLSSRKPMIGRKQCREFIRQPPIAQMLLLAAFSIKRVAFLILSSN